MKIENVLVELKKDGDDHTLLQHKSNSTGSKEFLDHVMFLNDSQIRKMGDTQQMFSSPKQELTKKYLSGEMG